MSPEDRLLAIRKKNSYRSDRLDDMDIRGEWTLEQIEMFREVYAILAPTSIRFIDATLPERANLSGIVLSGAVFCESVVRGVDFSGSTLINARMSNIDMSGADLRGIKGGYIILE